MKINLMRMRKRITQKVIKKTKEIIKKINLTKKNEKEDNRDNTKKSQPKRNLDNFPKSKLRAY